MPNLKKLFISICFIPWLFQYAMASEKRMSFEMIMNEKKSLLKIILQYLDPIDCMHTTSLTATTYALHYPHLTALVFARYVKWLQHPPRALTGARADAAFLRRAVHGDIGSFLGNPILHLYKLPLKLFTSQAVTIHERQYVAEYFGANDRFITDEIAPHYYFADELPLGYDRFTQCLTLYQPVFCITMALRVPERLVFTNGPETQFHTEDMATWNGVTLDTNVGQASTIELTWESRQFQHLEFMTVFNASGILIRLAVYWFAPTDPDITDIVVFEVIAPTTEGKYKRDPMFSSNILSSNIPMCRYEIMYAYYYPDVNQ